MLLVEGLDPASLIISPNGVAFAPPSVRPGVLPRLLREILETRVMVRPALPCHLPTHPLLKQAVCTLLVMRQPSAATCMHSGGS